eukprot:XP_001609967.1 hypothetical protein [Babesia bovis T2Bo]
MGGPPKPMMMPDMAPMMPFDMSRFEGPGMMPPMFPFQVPPMGMPGIPIPPPPAPQPMVPESDEYQIEMAAMADEMMHQGMYVQPPPVAPPYVPPTQPLPPQVPSPHLVPAPQNEPFTVVEPYMAAEIASIMHTLTSSQLTHALAAFKLFHDKSPINAKRLLINNPQLVYALLHAQYILGNVDEQIMKLCGPDQHMTRLNRKERANARSKGRHAIVVEGSDDSSADIGDTSSSHGVTAGRHKEPKPKDSGAPPRKGSKPMEAEHRPDMPQEGMQQGTIPQDQGAATSGIVHNRGQPVPPPPPPHDPAVTASQAAMYPPGSHVDPQAGISCGTIEDLIREVQPAPPILVEEVLKHTEILTK